jgi:hypothetical protein
VPHAIAAQRETEAQHGIEVRASTRCGLAEQHEIEAQDATPYGIAAQASIQDGPGAPDVMQELYAALAAIHSSASPPCEPAEYCESPVSLRPQDGHPRRHAQHHDSPARYAPVPSSVLQPQLSLDAHDWY